MPQFPNGPPSARQRNGRHKWVQVNQTRSDYKCIDELVTTITLVVAETKGVNPLDQQSLPIMYDAIDMQSLENAIFEPERFDRERSGAKPVNFLYAGYNIRLETDGWVTVYERR